MDGLKENFTVPQTEKKEKKKKKKKKKWLLLLLLLLLCFACGGGYYVWKSNQPKSKYEADMNALAGFLPGKTDEEIQNELNRIIEEGYFNASINGEMTLENGSLNVHIENVPANHYDERVEVYLYPDQNDPENSQLIYESGIIKIGYYIEDGEAKTDVKPGKYIGRAVFHAITPDEAQEEIGKTILDVLIEVK